jgi:hypothetical protein
VCAVCENRFSRGEIHSILRPENPVADTVRNKHGSRHAQTRDVRFLKIEIRVMARDDNIVQNGASQLRLVFCSARNHGIRIEDTAIVV